MTVTIQRDELHRAIDELPDNALIELAKFIESLKSESKQVDQVSISIGEPAREGYTKVDTESEESKSFNPVYFPEGILKGFDLSPDYIAEARKEFLAGFGEGFE